MKINLIRCLLCIACLITVLFSCKKKDTELPPSANLIVTNISDTSCLIKWDAVNGVTGYRITIAVDEFFNSTVSGYNKYETTNTEISIHTLTPYTKYFIRLVTYTDQKESAPVTTDFTTLDADRLVILPWDQDKLYAFDARNGQVKWTFSGARFFGTPIVANNIVYIGGMDNRLYAIDVTNGQQKWRSSTTGTAGYFTANALIKDGVVYIGDYAGRCLAYDASTGGERWYYDVPSPYKNINSSAILDGGTVYFASYDGRIYALDAATGVYKFKTPSTGNPIISGMSLIDGTIYVGATPKVYAFDAATGSLKWSTPSPQYTVYYASPTVAENKVFIGGEDGVMYAFNTADGSIAWSKVISTGSIVSSPVYRDGKVYFGGGDGKMYALQSSYGSQVWQSSAAGTTKNIYSGPTLSTQFVYSGTLDGQVVSMDIQTGVAKWVTTIAGARFQASPCVINYKGDVFYPGLSGDIH